MSKRLQVLLDDHEFRELRRIARRKRMTVSEWVRQVLRSAREQEPRGSPAKKLQAIQAAYEYSFPTADIDRMLAEIETGYKGSDDP